MWFVLLIQYHDIGIYSFKYSFTRMGRLGLYFGNNPYSSEPRNLFIIVKWTLTFSGSVRNSGA